ASLAGDDGVVQAAFVQAGITRAGDLGEFLSLLKTFDRLHRRHAGKRVAIVCTTGAGGVLAADQLGLHGLELAHLSKPTMARLHERFPAWLEPNQPLDISPTMMKIGPNRALQYAAEVVLADENVDALLLQTFGLPATASFDPAALAASIAGKGKAAVAWLYGVRTYLEPWTAALEAGGLPVMPDLRSAARALQALAARTGQESDVAAGPTLQGGESGTGVQLLPDTAGAFDLLRRYGIPAAQGVQVADAEGAVRAAQKIGKAVAVKLADMAIA